ncbi:phosphoglucosamine mutase [Endozoicomonas sp. SM1973]|uniref:Phosphoglucosamine mutase n=1 Tax=Spartinivicinus marinus TaxID=2994442 RepID=A0A853IGI1_9GAMM|nr:phosphoglucosamine mutase [Spartinivicinus marinus]MCX4027979.1 phosphoglucosamine mutase [Spartinivicinus marinus]NYZ68255.1 phosphoglucosamine mutase [Spartinivicinus marinus]
MKKKYFGTDGIRGQVGQYPITPDFMLKLGWAAGKVFAQEGRGKILIGKDTRISGYMFEAALEAGLSAAGVDVSLLGPMPTPAIAYLTRTFNAHAGIVISASHNPYQDNGIKFFSATGTKLGDHVELAIEAMLEQEVKCVDSGMLGKATRINDAAGRYIEYCKGTVAGNLDLSGLKIVVDAANGATYHVGPAVFGELGAEVVSIGVEPNGININKGVGSTHLTALQQKVIEEKADLGIAFDGDGDRVMMVDHQGQAVDGDELLFIIASSQAHQQVLHGGVVGTLMTNLGMELALSEMNIPFARAKVGDRYVNEMLLAKGWYLGGESSGHIICRDVATTGDGIVSALQVLKALQSRQLSLFEVKQQMCKFPQKMVNVKLTNKVDIAKNTQIQAAVSEVEAELSGKGRVLLRPSGTEPVIRVMVEGEDELKVNMLVSQLADAVKEAVVLE